VDSTKPATPGDAAQLFAAPAPYRWRDRRRQYVALQRVALKAQLQYRANFWTALLGGIALQGVQLVFLSTLLARFNMIAGWEFSEVAFLFAVRLAAHALYVVPFGSFLQVDYIIHEGEFDRYLLRPASPFLQLITRQFPLMSLGDALLGFGALVIFGIGAPIDWSPLTIAYLVGAIIGGGLVETATQIFLGGLTFVMTSTFSLRVFADSSMSQFSGYPLTMFGRWLFYGLTFIFPMAFVAYLPTTLLLGRQSEVPLPDWLIAVSPLAGPILLGAALTFFNRMTRRYTSPGG